MVSIAAQLCALVAGAAMLTVELRAQRILVNVRDAALKSGVAGAVVRVVESETGAEVFGLTNDAGRAAIKLPAPGAWAVSVRRIGIVPATAAAVRVDSEQSVTVSIAVSSTRFSLPAVRVSAAATCGRAPRGNDRAATLWEQVSLALRAATLTRADSLVAPSLWVQVFERTLDRNRKPIRQTPLRSGRGSDKPFFAAHPDSLERGGYVRREPDGTYQYFAPDDVVLLSESFLRTHCFESPASDADPRLAELQFRPVPSRSLPDVAGTAFVDTATGELRRIEFRFVNVASFFVGESPDAGGDVSLRPLQNGQWIVSEWTIRMPTFLRVAWRGVSALTGYREVGGVVDVGEARVTLLPNTNSLPGGDVDSTTVVPGAASPLPSDSGVSTPDSIAVKGATYQFGRIPGSNLSGRRITVTPESPPQSRARRDSSAADTSVTVGTATARGDGVTARMVEVRSGFATRRRFGVGTFFDAAALATQPGASAFDLLRLIPSLSPFRVPDETARPPADGDVDLAREWRAGADLPMVPIASTDSTTTWLCLVKLFLNGRRASVAQLRALPASELAALEYYQKPRDVPGDFRRSGNRCGTALLWSYAGDRPGQ